METITPEKIIELVEMVRAALTEKMEAAKALKAAWLRDIAANRQISEMRTALHDVQFEELGHFNKLEK